MDRTPEVVILPVSDIADARASRQELKVPREKPLVPVEHRGRFGDPGAP